MYINFKYTQAHEITACRGQPRKGTQLKKDEADHEKNGMFLARLQQIFKLSSIGIIYCLHSQKRKQMITATLILIFVYILLGKDTKPLMDRLKNIDWNKLYADVRDKIRIYGKKAGRIAAKPLLIFYYVLKDKSLSSKERLLIYGCIFYVISPVTIIPQRVFRLLGVMDEATAIVFVIRKIRDKITPEVIAKADTTIEEWFGEPANVC